jgi:hypothetical protein
MHRALVLSYTAGTGAGNRGISARACGGLNRAGFAGGWLA